jgi:RNA polymerase sigma-70 factor (ECF subfamily)
VSATSVTSTLLERAPREATTDRLGRLFEAHRERLFRLACRLAADREEARDLVQETFLRAARHPSSLPDVEPGCEAWLVRALVNLCRDRHRRLVVRRRESDSLTRDARDAHDESPHPETAAVARATVRAALANLPPRRRAVVVLCEIEGVAVSEAARLLGVSEVTVRWHRMTARRQLAKELS